MRMRTCVPIWMLSLGFAFAPAALADDCDDNKDEDLVAKRSTWWMFASDDDEVEEEVEHREAGVTIRTYAMETPTRGKSPARQRRVQEPTGWYTTYGYVGAQPAATGRELGDGSPNLRIQTGPYKYIFTDSTGQYDYYLDHYGYPYSYGGRPISPPVDVFGYVPPDRIGGGPVVYTRNERPVSWSVRRQMTPNIGR